MEIAGLEPRHQETEVHFDRSYQQYSLLQQINLAPVDEQEQVTQERQHGLLKELWNDWPLHRLYPNLVGSPEDVLDCGFGAGFWAKELAAQDSSLKVTGVDISPQLAPTDKPTNLRLQICNLNEKVPYPDESFDLVHSRFIASGIGRFKWPAYLTEIYRVLRVGGWIQIIEWEIGFRSNNGRGDNLGALEEWANLYNQALGATGYPEGMKSVSVAQDCGAWLRTARFERVQTAFKEVPTCGWSTNPRWRQIGESNLSVWRELIDSLAFYPVVARGIRDAERFRAICDQAKEELLNSDAQPFVRLYACWGRKETAIGDG